MVSELGNGSSSPGSSPGRGHCVVFLANSLFLLSLCLSPPVSINGYRRQNADGGGEGNLRWTSIPSRRVAILLVASSVQKPR